MAQSPLEMEPEDQELVASFERLLAHLQARAAAAAADGAAMDYGALEQEVAQQMAELRSQAQQALLRTQPAQRLRKQSP